MSPATAIGTLDKVTLPRVSDLDLVRALDAPRWPPCAGAAFELQQRWRPVSEPALRPGTVWFTATREALLVFAQLTGDDARTRAQADHELLWELGDVFEIFVQPFGAGEYFEFQIAPNGCVLQLNYPHVGAPRHDGVARYIRRDRLIEAAVRIDPANHSWRVAARLPADGMLAAASSRVRGEEWRLAASRYDYDAAGRATISATAAFTRPDFHRVGEWSRAAVPGGFSLSAPVAS